MRQLPEFLRPAPPAGERPPADSAAGRYVRSFLFERLVIGVVGLTLPFALVFLDRWLFHGTPFPRNSESAYYYSGMREWFTLAVGGSGFFFIAYKVTEKNLDNTLSLVGGACALLIATFPTAPGSDWNKHEFPLTPLQKLLGKDNVGMVHVVSSFGFILAIGGITILFGLREKDPSRRYFHFACAAVIGLALVWSIVTGWILGNHPRWCILAGETACALAFSASWLVKGFEIDYVLGRRVRRE